MVLEDEYQIYGALPNVDEKFALCFPDSGPIHEAMWWSTQTTHAPAPFHLGPCLAMLCHELAWRGWRIDSREQLVPQIWVALIGSPSSGKSTAMRLYRELYRDTLVRFNGGAGPGGPPGGAGAGGGPSGSTTVVDRPDFIVDTEGTPQGLLEHLARFRYSSERNETHGLLYEEEMSQLLEPDKKITEYLIKLADGETINRKLRQMQAAQAKGERVFDSVRNPRLSAVFSATEASIRRVMRREHIEGGLFSRLWWITAQLTDDARRPFPLQRPEQRAWVVNRWNYWLAGLDGLEMIHANLAQQGAISKPKIVEIPENVKQLYIAEWFNLYEKRAHGFGPLEATVMRLGRTIRMLTGVFAISRHSDVADEVDMDAAIQFGKHLLKTAGTVSGEASKGSEHLDVERVFDIVQAHGMRGVTKTELWKTSGLSRRGFKDALELLEDLGRVQLELKKTGKKGRPAQIYRTGSSARKMDVLRKSPKPVEDLTQEEREALEGPFEELASSTFDKSGKVVDISELIEAKRILEAPIIEDDDE